MVSVQERAVVPRQREPAVHEREEPIHEDALHEEQRQRRPDAGQDTRPEAPPDGRAHSRAPARPEESADRDHEGPGHAGHEEQPSDIRSLLRPDEERRGCQGQEQNREARSTGAIDPGRRPSEKSLGHAPQGHGQQPQNDAGDAEDADSTTGHRRAPERQLSRHGVGGQEMLRGNRDGPGHPRERPPDAQAGRPGLVSGQDPELVVAHLEVDRPSAESAPGVRDAGRRLSVGRAAADNRRAIDLHHRIRVHVHVELVPSLDRNVDPARDVGEEALAPPRPSGRSAELETPRRSRIDRSAGGAPRGAGPHGEARARDREDRRERDQGHEDGRRHHPPARGRGGRAARGPPGAPLRTGTGS